MQRVNSVVGDIPSNLRALCFQCSKQVSLNNPKLAYEFPKERSVLQFVHFPLNCNHARHTISRSMFHCESRKGPSPCRCVSCALDFFESEAHLDVALRKF